MPPGATRASLASGGTTPGGGEVRVSVGRDADRPALTGALDPTAADALTRLVVRDPSTPGHVALLAGAGDGAAVFARWTGLLLQAVDAGDLAGIHRSAEAVVNVVRGGPGRDLDGDGRVEAPGDGHALLAVGAGGYVDQERDVAQTVARLPASTPRRSTAPASSTAPAAPRRASWGTSWRPPSASRSSPRRPAPARTPGPWTATTGGSWPARRGSRSTRRSWP